MNSDALTGILQMVRLEGTIFSRAVMEAPFGVRTGPTEKGIFHAVVEGEGWIQLEEGEEEGIHLMEGDVVFLPHGDSHAICDALSTPARPIGEFQEIDEESHLAMVKVRGFGQKMSLICGSFSFERSEVHPLLSSLPGILHYRSQGDELSRWIATTLELILEEIRAGEPGSQTVITRMTDVLLVYALRYFVRSLAPGTGGWLSGLQDRHVGQALGLIHNQPQQKWTAAVLARRVGMSRSAFFARFSELIGEPPQRYLTRWRMFLAAQALQKEDVSMAQIAERVGYASESAFSKAFKRCLGIAPAHYRRELAAA